MDGCILEQSVSVWAVPELIVGKGGGSRFLNLVAVLFAQMVHISTSIRTLNSGSRTPHSEFRISKKNCGCKFVFGDATSGFVHGVGQGIQN